MSQETFNLVFSVKLYFCILCLIMPFKRYWILEQTIRFLSYRLLIIVTNILSAIDRPLLWLSNYYHSESFRTRCRLLCVWTEKVYNCKQTISLFIVTIYLCILQNIWYALILQVDFSLFIVLEQMLFKNLQELPVPMSFCSDHAGNCTFYPSFRRWYKDARRSSLLLKSSVSFFWTTWDSISSKFILCFSFLNIFPCLLSLFGICRGEKKLGETWLMVLS